MDKLIAQGTVQKMQSFLNLRANDEFLPVSRSALGKGYDDEEEEDSDVEEGVEAL